MILMVMIMFMYPDNILAHYNRAENLILIGSLRGRGWGVIFVSKISKKGVHVFIALEVMTHSWFKNEWFVI